MYEFKNLKEKNEEWKKKCGFDKLFKREEP